MRVAMVAADTMSQVLLEEHIQALGLTFCGWAATLDEGLDLLGRSEPDVVVLDPYFDSTLIDPEWLGRLLGTADFQLVLIGVDPDRDRDLIKRLNPIGTIGAPPSLEEVKDVLSHRH